MKRYFLVCAGVGLLSLSACGGTGSTTTTTSTALEKLQTGLSDAQLALTAYQATPNPSETVITKASQLIGTAEAAISAYEDAGTDTTAAAAAAAIAAIVTYEATAAPGNGVTPASN